MADDTDITGGSSDSPQRADVEAADLIPEQAGRRWPPLASVIVIGFIVAVVAVVLIERATDGNSIDSATDTIVGEPADEPADQPAGDTDGRSTDGSERTSDESSDDDIATGDFVAGDAAAESSMFGGGGDWLVPWRDGFLRFGLVFAPQPLPELDGRFDDLFPPEVVETLEAAGATNIDEATDVLLEAGLYDQVLEVIDANPEVAEWLFGVEPPAPTFEISQSSDGLDWVPLDGVSIPGGQWISWVQSDGEHLIVGSQQYSDVVDDRGPGTSTLQVAITSDLRDWEIHDITGTAGEDVPDSVQVDTSIGGVAIGPDGWVAATNTYAFIDEWALLPEDIREIDGWWELSADESGLTVQIFADEYAVPAREVGEEGDIIVEPFKEPYDENCCDPVETRLLSWDEVGIDYATWQQYRDARNGSMTVWTASWGEPPVETPVQGYGSFGSLTSTDAGFLAISWTDEHDGNVLLFSTNGRRWTELASPVGNNTWVDQLVAVDGGVIATVSGPIGQVILLGDSDGTNWREVDVPGVGDNTWIWFNPGSGAATIVDVTDYSEFEECYAFDEPLVVELDLPDHFVFIVSWPDGTELSIESHADGTSVQGYSDVPYPEGTPEFMVFDDAAGEVAFLDPDTGDEVVRMPTDDFLAAWEQARDDADERAARSECEGEYIDGPFLEGDYQLVATIDGSTWLVEDLDEGGEEPYPQQAAINGNVVVARIGENWNRYTIG